MHIYKDSGWVLGCTQCEQVNLFIYLNVQESFLGEAESQLIRMISIH